MKKILLLLALAGATTFARAQTPEPATDASGVPLINKSLPAPGVAVPPAPAPARHLAVAPEQLAARQSQRLARELGLSATQQGQVQQILLGEYQGLAAARQQAQAAGTRRGMGRALQADRAQADQQLRQVLTPEQYGRYQQLLAQRRQRRQKAAQD